MTKVFICYRRRGAAGEAHLLYSNLKNKLGEESVFKDVDSISLGRDFRKVLQRTLDSCDVMLVVIGKHWADVDESGKTRLEDPRDYVRMEIEAALKRDIPITPLLTQGARMPTAEQLPAQIEDFAYRNAFELSHNRWDSDVEEMIKRLGLLPDPPVGGRGPNFDGKTPVNWPTAKQWLVWSAIGAFILIFLEFCSML